MEEYAYISIIFFLLIIFFLYIYIMYEKLVEFHNNKRIQKYSEELIAYIDSIVNEILSGKELNFSNIKDMKILCENKDKRELIEKRLLYYFENFKGDFLPKLIELCEYLSIIKYELKNLQDKNNYKKALAARRLGEFRSKEALYGLLKEFNTENSDVKYNILLALAKIGEEEAFIKAFESIDSSVILSERSLIEIVDSFEGDKMKIYKTMINSKDSFTISIFIKSAGNFKNTLLSDDIAKYLFSKNKELRIASAKAIGSICDETYLNDLIKLLEDDEWEVRAVTSRVLGNFKDNKILNPLAKALFDSEWHVRYNAATSILKHSEGMSVVSYIFNNDDKFAKDIIISAIENTNSDILEIYENSNEQDKVELALKIKDYISKKNEEGHK